MKPSHIVLIGLTLSAVSGYYLMQPTEIVYEQKELLSIEPLYGREQYFKSIMEMQKDEWKVSALRQLLKQDQSENNDLPYTIIALYDGLLVGSCTLGKSCQLDAHHSPWVSHLYVLPDFRGKKIAKQLILTILQIAKKLGVDQIFYATNNPNTTSIYHHLGGTTLHTTFSGGQTWTIMEGTIDVVLSKNKNSWSPTYDIANIESFKRLYNK